MYEAFFGLSARPFAEHASPDVFVESEQQAAALRALRDGIGYQHPLFLVTGEVGCGKTMLGRKVVHGLGAETTIGFIAIPKAGTGDIGRWALLGFGLEISGLSDEGIQEALTLFIIAEYAEGRRCLLVIDEAQNLSPSALAGLHKLLDLNSAGDCLLQIVLVGQPLLLQTIHNPGLAEWAERTPLVCFVDAWLPHEIAGYVRSRLAAAGAQRAIFTNGAIEAIGSATGGIPRMINTVCDIALTCALSLKSGRIDRKLIREVVSEGRSASFGSLSMLTPIDDAPEIVAATVDEESEEIIAPVTMVTAASDAAAESILDTQGRHALAGLVEAEALPSASEMASLMSVQPPGTAMQESDPVVSGERPVALEVGLNSDPTISPTGQELAAQAQAACRTAAVAAWPSISGRNDLSQPSHRDVAKSGARAGSTSVRRRFLPRN